MLRTDALGIPLDLVQVIAEIDEFKGEWNKSSKLAPEHHETAAEIYQHIFLNYPSISISEEEVKKLHGMLQRFGGEEQKFYGEYKTSPNHVQGFDERGRSLGIIFETVLPTAVPYKLQELLSWVRVTQQDHSLHPLITTGIFLAEFLAIQPFQDDNGKLAWVLATLLLLKAGYLFMPYCALENSVEDNKENFYQALRKTQNTFNSNHVDWVPWLKFFLQTLQTEKRRIEKKVEVKKATTPNLPQLSTLIFEAVQQRGRLSTADIVSVTNANRNTIKKHLEKLVDEAHLLRHGKGKGTWYTVG